MVVELLSSLDTYIYPMLTLIVWNFYWTRRVKGKVFGDPKDKTVKGLLIDHQRLEERVQRLEQVQKLEPTDSDETSK